MADEQRVSQGGVTVGAELASATQRVSQGGVTVGATLVFKMQTSQVGVTVPSELAAPDLWVSQVGVTVISHVIPDPPTALAAVATGASTIAITWTNNVMDRTALWLQRGPDGLVWSDTFVIGPNETGYLDAGLLPSTIYYYRIAAVINGVVGTYTAAVNATTLAAAGGAFPVIWRLTRRHRGR